MKKMALVISCEHAVNTVPVTYQPFFAPYQSLLNTHRGIDFGALEIAKGLQQRFNCDFVQAEVTRLLIDCNRSLWHSQCFSEISKSFSEAQKKRLIEDYYLPFRQQVERSIHHPIQQRKQVLHLSIHSFTPIMNGIVRNADLCFLYDPKRRTEKSLAKLWQQKIRQEDKDLRVRMNYPYRGTSDGFTSALRKRFADKDYAGIEIEINQALVKDSDKMIYLLNLLSKIYKKTLL